MLGSLQNSLLGFLNIRRGEGQGVALVLLYGVLLFSANVLIDTASYALFLTEFGADSLPYAYIGVAAVAPLLSLMSLKLNERFALGPVLLGTHALLLIAKAAVWLGLLAAPAWLIFSLPIFFGVINALMYASFWNLLGRLYSLQQGKRLFGLLGSGGNIATILLGFATPLLVAWLGTVNLFLAAALIMVPTLAVLILLLRINRALLTASSSEESGATGRERPSPLLRDRYIQLIIAMFVLMIVGIYIVNNLFYGQAERMFPSEDALAAFLGPFFGLYGVISLIMQLFVSGRVLSRFGVQPIILATPAGLLLFGGIFTLTGLLSAPAVLLFWIASAMGMYRLVMDAIDVTAVNVLYQPLPDAQRTQAQTMLDGIIYPLSIGLAGLLLLLLTGVLRFDPVYVALVALPIFAAWLLFARAVGRAYPQRLREALSGRRFGGTTLPRPDRSTLEALQQGLASPQLGVVLYTLDLLAEYAPDALSEQLPMLLSHPEREVRLATLRWIERLGLKAAIPLIRDRLVAEGSRPVQAASLRTLALLGDQAGFDLVTPYLEHPEAVLRHGAVVGLLRSGELEGILLAGEQLLGWVRSRRPEERALAAQALGEGGITGFYRPLLALLQDEQAMVKHAALTAAGALKHPNLWPVVATGLASPQVRSAAVTALAAGGDAALPTVEQLFDQPGQRRDVAARLARVSGRIGGERATRLLRRHLDWPDLLVRSDVVAALTRSGYRADAAERVRIHEALQAEAAHATWTLASLRDVGAGNGSAPPNSALRLLQNALEQSLRRQLERIFHWLALAYDPQTIREVRTTLLAAQQGRPVSAQQRDYALEVLELLLPAELRAKLRPLVEPIGADERLARLEQLFPQPRLSHQERLTEIMTADVAWVDPWVNACACAVAGQPAAEGATTMLSLVEKVLLLRTVELFDEVADEVLADAAATLVELEVKAGDTIVARDELSSAMYLVVDGEVSLQGSARESSILRTQELFGELSLLNPVPHPAVTAQSDARLLRLERAPLLELLEEHPAAARAIMQRLAQRLQRAAQGRSEAARADLLGGLKEKLGRRP